MATTLFFANLTTNSSSGDDQTDRVDITFITLEIIVAITSTIANACAIIVLLRHPKMRSVTNLYVVSLAGADLLVGMGAIPFTLLSRVGQPKLFEACIFMNSLTMVLFTSSVFSMIALSIDRYIAIIYPLRYKTTVTSKYCILLITMSWVMATIVGLLPLMGWNLGRPPVPRCYFMEVMDQTYLLTNGLVTCTLPSIFIAVVYCKIYLVVRAHLRNLGTVNPATEYQKPLYSKAETKAAKSLAIIVVVFIISWIPLYLMNVVMYFCPDCVISETLSNCIVLLSHSNSMWNPALYVWGLKDFRAGLKNLFCCTKAASKAVTRDRGRELPYII